MADSRKGTVTLVDLNKLLDPGGHYQTVVDGVTVRNSDGIHLTKAGGEWLQPDILPDLASEGLAAEAAGGRGPMSQTGTRRPRPGLTARPSATGKERIAALDGLRAVALLIIMGYHFGVGWLQGGFFSLDIFYVLSGYLITGLLLERVPQAQRHQAVGLLAAPGPAAAAGPAHRAGGRDPAWCASPSRPASTPTSG